MGGPSSTKSTTTQDLPAWQLPYAKQGLASFANLTMPGGQFLQMPPELMQKFFGMTPQQQAGLSGIQQTAMGPESALLNQASGLLNQTIGGKFLDPESNPMLMSTYQQAARGLADAYSTGTAPQLMSQAAQAGALGGSAYGQAAAQSRYGLGQNLANLATDIFGGAYNTERGLQNQAMQFAPQMGQALTQPYQQMYEAGALTQADQQAQEANRMQNALRGIQYPLQQGSQFENFLRGLGGGQSVSISPNLNQGIK